MQQLPHRYSVHVTGPDAGNLRVSSSSLPDLVVAAPVEFDGPGDRWSPETLLVAAVGSCLILTFRSIAQASRFDWTSLDCQVEATLDKAEDGRRFTTFAIQADITVPEEGMEERAQKLLEKAEDLCLITNSLRGETRLEVRVVTAAGTP
jgi:organic hydroperoxide reductase OsmC/OhrA